ncbi:MAG TPA: hypothetical protein EYH03_02940 [Chromatiales bacterium]|nr:hypothetical protein [Chromatiales bacterium]
MTALDDSLDQLGTLTARNGGRGCYLVLMPEYRPDISKAFAQRLGLEMFDYRAEVMAPYGMEAHKIPLADLTDRLQQETAHTGILAHNVEALLATKPETERRKWLSDCLLADWPQPLLLVLSIFPDDAPTESGRVLDLRDLDFEDQSLISRLLH